MLGSWNQHLLPPSVLRLGEAHEDTHVCWTPVCPAGGLSPRGKGWASHRALQDGRDYHGASRPSQNVNPHPSFLLYCCWIFLANAPHPQFPVFSILLSQLNSGAHQGSDLLPVLVFLLISLDPCFFLRSDEDSFTVPRPSSGLHRPSAHASLGIDRLITTKTKTPIRPS